LHDYVLFVQLKLKFMNLKFEEIPSKTQIFGKEATRMSYFNSLI